MMEKLSHKIMRYLKSYNESINSDQMFQDIDDILLELVDIGYEYAIKTTHFSKKPNSDELVVIIYDRSNNSFKNSDSIIEVDCIERLIFYLSKNKYVLEDTDINRIRKPPGFRYIVRVNGDFRLYFKKSE